MRLKIGFLVLFSLLASSLAFAEEDLEATMRRLSVDVPKQQAEFDSRLTATQEELAQLKEQLLVAQQQVVKLENSQQESTAQLQKLEKSLEYLKRELELQSQQIVSWQQNPELKLQKLEAQVSDLKRTSLRNLLFVAPPLLLLSLF
jgi:peptidoglycan hydrolase CwlO-like protein